MTTPCTKKDCTKLVGFTWKCTVALRYLAYGAFLDTQDDHLRMPKSTCFERVYLFWRAVVAAFGPIYLRASNEEDIS
jgi:hypothetical protein